MKRSPRVLLFASLSLAAATNLFSQPRNNQPGEAGTPFIQNFSHKEYKAHAQNWAIVQDDRGVLYFGNTDGLLIFDGAYWRLLQLPNKSPVSGLAVDKSGRIFVGARNEFGFLAADSLGQLEYISLMALVPPEEREFGNIWGAVANGDEIYFEARKYLFRWSGFENVDRTAAGKRDGASNGKLKIFRTPSRFSGLSIANGVVYGLEKNKGLFKIQGDSLQLVPDGGALAKNFRPTVLPLAGQGSEQTLLISTMRDGLFGYDRREFKRFPTQVDSFLIGGSLVYHAAVLGDSSIVLATLREGAFQIDRHGKLLGILNKNAGLRDQHINFLFPDREGGLWLAMNEGIARAEMPSPFSLFNESHGIPRTIYRVIRHGNRLVAVTSTGIYHLSGSGNAGHTFKKIEGIDRQAWYLASARGALLAATSQGVYRVAGNSVRRISAGISYSLYPSQRDSDRVYVGLINGLALLQWRDRRWQLVGRFDEIESEVRSVAEDKNGDLWLGTRAAGVLRVTLPSEPVPQNGRPQAANISRFGVEHGLPAGGSYVYRLNNDIGFATAKGLRYFEPETQRFLPDSTLGGHLADTTAHIDRVVQDARGDVWLLKATAKSSVVGLAQQTRNEPIKYDWVTQPFGRLADWTDQIYQMYPDENEVVWFGAGEALIRYDPTVSRNVTRQFSAMVRRVTIGLDSLIYGGHPENSHEPPVLDFGNHVIRFEFAAASYDDPSANRFQYFLEGFDEDWSSWTSETRKDYTTLPEGNYRFRVRARNIYGAISREDTFEFSISPPWFRTWWAYSIYVVLLAGLIWGLRLGRVTQLEKRTQELESIAAERTKEVRAQTEKLKATDSIKSRFFANISHEFRTPLTLIIGPAEELIKVAPDNKSKQKLSLIHHNASRLLQLINQMLDLSKLETGKMQLQASPGDFPAFLKGLVMSFESWAQEKGMDLKFAVHDAPQPGEISEVSGSLNPSSARRISKECHASMYFDGDKIQKIFTNLLSNAFKFTPAGGSLKVTCTLIADCRWGISNSGPGPKYEIRNPKCEACINRRNASDGQDASPSGNCVEIAVADTGIGIPEDRLPHIFDRFYQVDSSSTRENAGTGIGLALVQELVQVHKGSIQVESAEGHGTTFTVCLPLGKEHLKPEESVDDIASVDTSRAPFSKEDFYRSPVEEDVKVAQDESKSSANDEQPTAIDDTIVLIIEDNADVRAYIREHLEPDYRVLEAKDGEEGIGKAVEIIPDLIISDVMMPKKDGYQVCQALKTDERTSHIPFILLTAKATAEEKIAGLETGADAYVLKPFRPKELAVRVRKLIELRRKLRERFSRATVIKPSEIAATSMDQAFLQQVLAAVEDHLGDEQFGLDQLATEVSMSASQLHRKLRALINQSPGQFLRNLRLQHAANLLKQQAGTVAEISYRVGFGSQAHFTKMFQKQFGCTPTEYQKRS